MNKINSLRNRLAQLDQEKASIINKLEQLVADRENEVNELRKVLEHSKQDTSDKDDTEATESDNTLKSAKKYLEQTYQSSETAEKSLDCCDFGARSFSKQSPPGLAWQINGKRPQKQIDLVEVGHEPIKSALQ